MKKKFKLVNLNCGHCAQKMEEAINKIDGVNDASVSFITLKLTIEADEDKFEQIIEQAEKCIHKVDSNCNILK